ncbi:VCBS repeat-containing protein [Candidatus Fermentibacteria bacterium]|nr:VCBS repeat-containing protein [Candidatus Fermentibacteria bacterium]
MRPSRRLMARALSGDSWMVPAVSSPVAGYTAARVCRDTLDGGGGYGSWVVSARKIYLLLLVALGVSCARSVPLISERYEVLMARGDSLAAYCRFDDAAAAFVRAMNAAPHEIDPWLRLGECFHKVGDPGRALDHWDRILAVRPREKDAVRGRWRALLAMAGADNGDSLQRLVRQEVDACALIRPRTESDLELAYHGYRLMGEDSLANAAGSMLAFRFPGSRLAFDISMESFYDSLHGVWNDTAGKAAFLRRYLRDNPESVMRGEAFSTLSATLAVMNRPAELSDVLHAWMRDSPDDPRALTTAAYWYLEKNLGDYRALQYARRAVDAVGQCVPPPGYPEERWELEICSLRVQAEASYAMALLRRGDIETAARMATDVVENLPERIRCEATAAPAYFVLGQCAVSGGRLAEAGEFLARALEAGDVRNVWTARADSLLNIVLRRMGSSDKTVEYSRNVLEYDGPLFEDVTSRSGLGEVGGGRVAWGDFDGDGFDDLLVGGNRLFHNVAGVTFHEVTTLVGLDGVVSSGGLFADVNNDGALDLLVMGTGDSSDRLFLGDGQRFEEVAGFPADGLPTEGAALGDFDGDGLLDVYLAKYECAESPGSGMPDRVLMNKGKGLFVDESGLRGIATGQPRAGRGVGCADYDADGDLDIFVSNYRLQPNSLWENDGSGRFVDVACLRGVRGEERDGWFGHTIGSDWGDFDGDGHLDLISANLAHPRYIHLSNTTVLLQNRAAAEGKFVPLEGRGGIPYEETSSDPCWADFDNDGDLDLYITSVYEGRRSYLLMQRHGRFHDVTYLAGVRALNGWGCAVSDFDRDGDLDLVVGSSSGIRLFRNDSWGRSVGVIGVGNGITTNADCIGCKVRVSDGARAQVREVQGGKGTASQNSLVQHFGLGRRPTYVEVEVVFTDGDIRVIPGTTPDQTIYVFQ